MSRILRGRWTVPDVRTVVLGGVGTALIVAGLVSVTPVDAQTVEPIEINSTWSDSLSLFESEWSDLFTDTSQPLAVGNVLATGDQFAKRNLLQGDAGGTKIGLDFIISGTRVTSAELATAPGKTFIHIPVAITSLSFAVRAPTQGWYTREPGFTETEDGEIIENPSVAYTGPIKIRPSLLFQLWGGNPVTLAKDSGFVADSGVPIYDVLSGPATAPIGRIDPGAISKNARTYFEKNSASDLTAYYTQSKIDPTQLRAEEWPFLSQPTRSNNSSLVNALRQSQTPSGGNASGGMVGTVETMNALDLVADFPVSDIRIAQIQNAAKRFVAPSKEAVLAGINAGVRPGKVADTFVENAALDDPALTTAYPLTWLDWMIVPAGSLTPDKANGVATIARFLVTAAQTQLDAAGTPALPASLVASALASADEVVTTNCTAQGYRVVRRNDAGPHAPATMKLPANTTIAWCEKIPVAPTTTTATSTTTSTSTTTTRPSTTTAATSTTSTVPQPPVEVAGVTLTAPPSAPSRSSGGATSSSSTTSAVPTTTAASPPVTTTTAPPPMVTEPPAATTLPLDRPVSERAQFDRFTTMGMGGACLAGAARRHRRRSES